MVVALSAKTFSLSNTFQLADYAFYIGTTLLLIGIIGWFGYSVARRLGWVNPAPQDLEQLGDSIDNIDTTVDDLNERLDDLEHQMQKQDLNSTKVEITNASGDITVRGDMDGI
jgi:hypothetical protein